MEFSSPVLQPQDKYGGTADGHGVKPDHHSDDSMRTMTLDTDESTGQSFELSDAFAWDTLESPENIQLSDLDDMFNF